jgi:hypothetical protein
MPTISNTTFSSSIPTMIIDGFGSGMPRVFSARSTALTSDVSSTGFWLGCGDGSKGANSVGMRQNDMLIHSQTTDTATPGRVSMHLVVASTANVASTSLSSGFSASYNVTVSSCT